MQPLDGPRILPSSGRAPAALVVLLHGYGSDGDDLIGLGETWRDLLPSAAFVAPHAPDRLPHNAMGGYQWFPLSMRDPTEYWRGAVAAAPALDRFLDAELTRHRLAPDRLALVGFSQGTMMALHVGLRRLVSPAVVIGFSGLLAGPEQLPAAPASPPKLVLVHGDSDDVVPADHLHIAREALATKGFPVEWHVRPGLGHGIDAVGLQLGGDALRRALRPQA